MYCGWEAFHSLLCWYCNYIIITQDSTVSSDSLEPSGIPSTSPTHQFLQLKRCETTAQWELQADSHRMKLLYYRNGNIKGVVNDTNAHAQVHTHNYYTNEIKLVITSCEMILSK